MRVATLEGFSRPLKGFLFTKALAYVQWAFVNFLINIYLWRISEDLSFLILYNIVFQAAHGLAYLPAGMIAKERDRFLPLKAGPLLNIVFLGLIVLLKGSLVEYVVPVALLGGLAHGLYWSSDNLLKFDLTRADNRLKFAAAHHIFQLLAYGLVPLVASLIVVSDGGVFSAYAGVFASAIAFSLLTSLSTLFISKEKRFAEGRYDLRRNGRRLLASRKVRLAMAGVFFSSIADALPVLIGLLLFFSTGTELSIGSYQLLTVSISAVAMYALGRYFCRKDYARLLVWGGLANFALLFILLFRQDYLSLLVYGILSSLFIVADTPKNPVILDAMASSCKTREECLERRIEYVTLTEIVLVAGTLIGFLVLLPLHFFPSPLAAGMIALALGLMQLVSNLILARITPEKTVDIDGLS